MKPTLQVIIGIVKNQNDEVLIVRKAEDLPKDQASGLVNAEGQKDFLLGLWHFPGGKLELGETLEEGTKREVNQETSVEVSVKRLLGEITEEREKVFLHISWYECEYISGEAEANDDVDGVMWVKRIEAQRFCAEAVVNQWPKSVMDYLKD